jgi:hypothetical protein
METIQEKNKTTCTRMLVARTHAEAWSLLITGAIWGVFAFVSALISTNALEYYEVSPFLGIPFTWAVVSTVRHGRCYPLGFVGALKVGLLPGVATCLLFLVGSLEGMICMLMAAPVTITSSLVGGLVGYLVLKHLVSRGRPQMVDVGIIALPLMGTVCRAHGQR